MSAQESNTHSPWIVIFKGYYKAENYISMLGMVMFAVHAVLLSSCFQKTWSAAVGVHDIRIEIFACFVSLVLWFSEFWSNRSIYLKSVVWYISVIILIPFWFSFTFLQNEGMLTWVLALIASFAGLAFLVKASLLGPVILLGVFSGLSFAHFISETLQMPPNIVEISTVLLLVLVCFAYFEFRKENLVKERMAFLKGVSGFIAHELRTPIASMMLGAKGLRYSMVEQLETIPQSYKNDIFESPYYNEFGDSVDLIEGSGREALISIDMFLLKLKGTGTPQENDCEAAVLVKEAFSEYPLNPDDIDLIDLELEPNFLFRGNKVMFKHIIYNLFKNSLYAIRAAQKGRVYISLKNGLNVNTVVFRDTASGIPAHKMGSIFKQFSSDKQSGTGLGVPFCKHAMEEMGGFLECSSEEGEYTEFILKFPKQK